MRACRNFCDDVFQLVLPRVRQLLHWTYNHRFQFMVCMHVNNWYKQLWTWKDLVNRSQAKVMQWQTIHWLEATHYQIIEMLVSDDVIWGSPLEWTQKTAIVILIDFPISLATVITKTNALPSTVRRVYAGRGGRYKWVPCHDCEPRRLSPKEIRQSRWDQGNFTRTWRR